MKKLYSLKNFLTLEETAKYLTTKMEEVVTIADVLQLAVDGRLRMSVNFVNMTHVRSVIQIDTDEWVKKVKLSQQCESLRGDEVDLCGMLPPVTNRLSPNDGKVAVQGNDIATFAGLINLPIPPIGGEILDLKSEYHRLTDGKEVTLTSLYGAFVEDEGGNIWQLQDSMENNIHNQGGIAYYQKLEDEIKNKKLPPEEAAKRLKEFYKYREIYVKTRQHIPIVNDFYSLERLPEDSILVVRKNSLKEFEQLISSNEKASSMENDIATQSSIYKLLKGVVELNYGNGMLNDLNQTRSTRLSEIKQDLETKGYCFDDSTLRKYLKNLPD